MRSDAIGNVSPTKQASLRHPIHEMFQEHDRDGRPGLGNLLPIFPPPLHEEDGRGEYPLQLRDSAGLSPASPFQPWHFSYVAPRAFASGAPVENGPWAPLAFNMQLSAPVYCRRWSLSRSAAEINLDTRAAAATTSRQAQDGAGNAPIRPLAIARATAVASHRTLSICSSFGILLAVGR